MTDYLAFVDEIGRQLDGKYLYRFDFTVDTDTVWGEYFNIAPSAIVPNIQPDKNTLSKTAQAAFPRQMIIAKKNYCFSMQDCIDGIMSMFFSEIDDNTLMYKDEPFHLDFGEPMESVIEKMESVGIKLEDIHDVEKGDDSAIDKLLENMDNNDGFDDDDPDAMGF